MRKPTKPELYAKVDDLTRRLKAAERVALANYRRWSVLAVTVEGWAMRLSTREPGDRLTPDVIIGLRDAVDREPRHLPDSPSAAADRVLAFLAARQDTRGLDPDIITGHNDVELTTADLQTIIGAVYELEVRKDFDR